MSSFFTVSPNLSILPLMTDAGAAKLAEGAKEFGVAALNTSAAKGFVVVAKGFVVVALIGVTGWAVARVIHELRDTTVKHNVDVNHRGTLPPPPPSTE